MEKFNEGMYSHFLYIYIQTGLFHTRVLPLRCSNNSCLCDHRKKEFLSIHLLGLVDGCSHRQNKQSFLLKYL